MRVEAPIKVDRKTKKLAKRLSTGDIAVINHTDIDEVAANSLVECKIKLVINAAPSISGRYPNKGPKILIDNNILIIDNVGEKVFEDLKEGQIIEVNNGLIYRDGQLIGQGEVMDKSVVEQKTKIAYENMSVELDRFIDNTIEYAKREKGFILGETEIPKMATDYKDRHVLVVVRGQDYKEDLATIRSYVRAPGLLRVQDLVLVAVVFPAPGTSEDIAMLTAYEYGAELIVALGSHSNMIDFLEKGRKGMASTFLVRLKIGAKLIDAKGVNLLYKSKLKMKYIWALVVTAIFPVLIIAYLSPTVQQLIKLLQLKMKLNM